MGDGRPRKLTAIMAADIAAYSALMGANEEATVRDLKSHQSVILPMISSFGGPVIDTAGDGILAEFSSVLNAVNGGNVQGLPRVSRCRLIEESPAVAAGQVSEPRGHHPWSGGRVGPMARYARHRGQSARDGCE
jgi:class 3 adenylate cyclase